MSPKDLKYTAWLLLLLAVGGARPLWAQAAGSLPPNRSVLDGVYTAEQATEGILLFGDKCARCHAAVDFGAAKFRAKWVTHTLQELYARVSTTMPFDQPSSLRPTQYAQLVAFLLAVNGYPPGTKELGWEENELNGIKIDPPFP